MTTFLLVASVLTSLAWTAIAARILIHSTRVSFARPIPWTGDGAVRSVDIVVPARNEERDIERTARDLLTQDYPGATLTVIDDQSTDRTVEILERIRRDDPRLHVIRGVERPPGWVGKTWALHQAVQGTSSEWILFVDGDMRLHPSALSTAVAEAERTDADMVSFVPRGECVTIWQASVALCLAQVLSQLYPLTAVNDPARPEALAAGGFILIKRKVYLAVGGHEAVRREIVEDIKLSAAVKQAGYRLLTLPAPELASTHMYGTLPEIVRGLRKNAYAGMEYLPHRYVGGVLMGLAVAWGPWVFTILGAALSNGPLALTGVWGIFAQAAASIPNCVFLGISPRWSLAFPIGLTVYVVIATASVLDYYSGRIHWKDRDLRTREIFGREARDGTNS